MERKEREDMGEIKGWGEAVSELFPLREDPTEKIAKGIGGPIVGTIPPDTDGDLTSGSISSDRLTVTYDPSDWATTLEVRGPTVSDHITPDMIYGSWEWGSRIEQGTCDRVREGAEDALAIIEKRCGIKRTGKGHFFVVGSVMGHNEELGKSAVACGAQMGAGDVIWEIRKEIETYGIRNLEDLIDALNRIESEWNIEGKIRKELKYKK